MNAARVGIVVRVFNTDPSHLREAVHSALNQTVPVRVVMIDDCSTDSDTLRTLKDLSASTLALLIRHETNRGPGVAMNTGVEALDVPYVFAMDSDDLVEATYAELASRVLDERPDVSVVTPAVQYFGATRSIESAGGAPNGVVDLLFLNSVPAFSVFRRRAWKDIGGYSDLRWAEDYDFWVRTLADGGITAALGSVQYHYRVHPDQTTATTTWEDKLAQQLEVVRRNPEVWATRIDVVMERLWEQQVELNYYKKRYGRFNQVKKDSIDAALRVRERLMSRRSRS